MDDIKVWRRGKRIELIARRVDLDAQVRRDWNARIDGFIERGFPLLANMVVGFCWPHRAEYDARFVAKHFRDRGALTALPAVVGKKTALEFRGWRPGVRMSKGVYDIPVPEGSDVVTPDALIVPMIAFDEQAYRLGYGGGYFDITLGAIAPKPLAIGVCYELFRFGSLDPQPHDIAMDFVVTENGIHVRREGKLALFEAEQCAEEATRLACERRLPRTQNLAHLRKSYSSPACLASEIAPDYFGSEPEA
ncbi:MAG: 5-formyltetrahydrofolate cyclo-ligase [Burkholderiales bacterium]